MLYHIEVTKDDFANGIPMGPFRCAFALAIGRHFPGKIVLVAPRRNYANPIMKDGVTRYPIIGYFAEVLNSLPDWLEIGPAGIGVRLREPSAEERAMKSNTLHRVDLPPEITDIIRKFDRGELQLDSCSFPLEVPDAVPDQSQPTAV